MYRCPSPFGESAGKADEVQSQLKSVIRDVRDFPKPGILFRDITPVFQNVQLCNSIVDEFIVRLNGQKIDAVVGVESRGFLFGIMLANRLNIPLVLVRKKGKLPYKSVSYEYNLEYGTAEMELQVDDIKSGWNVLIHDDVLATGGTADATARLIKSQKGNVMGFAFLLELKFLNGQQMINQHSRNIISLVEY
ncbi:MAG: adenine phosphoribosyltransferase [Bacteroidetes bacterium]|nr:adenine phosphoribosyltransferase [Bacteroidota bacterium]